MNSKGTRGSGSFTYLLPGDWKAEQTHYWLYLLSHDIQECSDSHYLVESADQAIKVPG